jgi:hypothetical protein
VNINFQVTYQISSPRYTELQSGRYPCRKVSTVSSVSFPNLEKSFTHASLSVRRRVPKLEGDSADAFIHNSLHYATAHFRLEPTTPVAEIAYQNRLALKQALDPKDIEIGMTVFREKVRRGQINLTCEPFERSFHITNWTSAWRDLDFSSVVKGEEKANNGSRRPKLLVLGEGRPGNEFSRTPRRCK